MGVKWTLLALRGHVFLSNWNFLGTQKKGKGALCCAKSLHYVRLSVTLWTIALQAPLSVGFSRQEYWSGLPCPLPGNLPNPGIEPFFLTSSALAGGFFITRATWEAQRLSKTPQET